MGPAERTHASAPPGPATYDDALAAIGRAVPEFAGMWMDGAGTIAIALTKPDPAAGDAARQEIAKVLRRPELDGLRIALRPAWFSFTELKAWHDALTAEVLALPAVVSTDVDERANVVRVGTSDIRTTEPWIRAVAEGHGVPSRAVVVVPEEPVVPELRDLNVPVVGGVEIGFVSLSASDVLVCTLGFAAVRDGVLGFVTNSHCTDRRGVVEHTLHQQPAGGAPVGLEVADPPHFTGGVCPAGRACRYSDSAFSTLPAPALYAQGYLARPPLTSSTWNGMDTFRITGTATPLLDESLSKVGRTTGLTEGMVTATCATYNVAGSSLTMVCQSRASYLSAGGDSGSPVFRVAEGTDVALAGIHWGSGGVFSPFDGVQRTDELGPLSACAPGFIC
jgi:hypothetical protein